MLFGESFYVIYRPLVFSVQVLSGILEFLGVRGEMIFQGSICNL